MSYILDALKKSEQERALGAHVAQPVESIFSTAGAAPDASTPVKKIILVFVLLALITFFFYIAQRMFEHDVTSNVGEVEAVGILQENSTAFARDVVVNEAVASEAVSSEVVVSDVAAQQSASNKALVPVAVELAPNQLTSQLSPIKITSHIFSSQPSSRSIVANGIRLKEGDAIEPNVQVHQITHQGMIIRVHNALFIIDRSRGWSK